MSELPAAMYDMLTATEQAEVQDFMQFLIAKRAERAGKTGQKKTGCHTRRMRAADGRKGGRNPQKLPRRSRSCPECGTSSTAMSSLTCSAETKPLPGFPGRFFNNLARLIQIVSDRRFCDFFHFFKPFRYCPSFFSKEHRNRRERIYVRIPISLEHIDLV